MRFHSFSLCIFLAVSTCYIHSSRELIREKNTQILSRETVAAQSNSKLIISTLKKFLPVWALHKIILDYIPDEFLYYKSINHKQLDIHAIAFSPDSQLLVSTIGSFINSWDARHDFRLLSTYKLNHIAWAITFSPDGKYIAVSGSDRAITIIYVTNKQFECAYTLKEHREFVNCVSFSPDSKYLASGSKDGSVLIWEVNTKKFKLVQSINYLKEEIVSISFSHKKIAAVAKDFTIYIFELHNNLYIQSHRLKCAEKWISRHFAFPGRNVLEVIFSDFESNNLANKPLPAEHELPGSLAQFSCDGSFFSCAGLSYVPVWKKQNNAYNLVRILKIQKRTADAVVFSPCGSYFVYAESPDIRILQLTANNVNEVQTLKSTNNPVHTVLFSPHNIFLVACDGNGAIKIWVNVKKYLTSEIDSEQKIPSQSPVAANKNTSCVIM